MKSVEEIKSEMKKLGLTHWFQYLDSVLHYSNCGSCRYCSQWAGLEHLVEQCRYCNGLRHGLSGLEHKEWLKSLGNNCNLDK